MDASASAAQELKPIRVCSTHIWMFRIHKIICKKLLRSICIFHVLLQATQWAGLSAGRSEVRWRPEQEASLVPPCSNLRSFESKCTVLKKVLVTWIKVKYVLSTMGISKESISKFLIGNRFHVKLRILSPENCKQSLRVKSWKAEVTADKKQTQDYNQNFVTQAHKS